MAELINAPRGTADVLPDESYRWHHIEKLLHGICERFGYKELRIPTFEHTELFARGVGDTTDVVGKEMYTFADRAGRSVTLRPEGTSGAVRAMLQNGVLSGSLPVRAYYDISCFRYEKPQAGRLREFHQVGIELFGAPGPDADCEVISVADAILREAGLSKVRLEVNSIGCPKCRKAYHEALKAHFEKRKDELCDTCRDRLERNPMRILDCKSPICQQIASGAPKMLDYLCEECSAHFEQLQKLLTARGIAYDINPTIVRGLDYYTKTVFELVHEGAGAQGVVCGGGRYDGLVGMLGGPATPGVGFGLGLERLLSVLDSEGVVIPRAKGPELFVCFADEAGLEKARELVCGLQKKGVAAQYDLNLRGLKGQMKYADKIGSERTMVVGSGELEKGEAALRDMASRTEAPVALDINAIAAALGR